MKSWYEPSNLRYLAAFCLAFQLFLVLRSDANYKLMLIKKIRRNFQNTQNCLTLNHLIQRNTTWNHTSGLRGESSSLGRLVPWWFAEGLLASWNLCKGLFTLPPSVHLAPWPASKSCEMLYFSGSAGSVGQSDRGYANTLSWIHFA